MSKIEKLSDYFPVGKTTEFGVENDLSDEALIVDAGFCIEAYGNPDGAEDKESSEGASSFLFIDTNVTYGQLLDVVAHTGSIKDATLTLRVVGIDETVETEYCKENPISALMSEVE